MRSEGASEVDLWHLLVLLGDGEGLADFHIRVKNRCYPALRDRPKRGVVFLHGENVIATRDCDPILGAFELRLEGEEVLIRFDIGIGLGDSEQAAKRTGNSGLVLLELMK